MTIETNLQRIADALEKIASGINTDRVGGSVVAQAAAVDGPAVAGTTARRPGRPPKEAAAPVVETPAPTPPEDDFLNDVGTAPEPEPTIDDVRKALVDYQTRCGVAEKARKVLQTVGKVDSLKLLKPENYKAVIAAAKSA